MKTLSNSLRTFCAVCLMAFAGMTLQAQDENLRLHLDFEQVDGTTVSDAASSGLSATLKNEATVTQVGKYHVLDLGNGTGYLDLGSGIGNLFRDLDTYTISMYYRVDDDASLSGAGFFLWTFSTSAACTSSVGKYSAYRLNAQRFAVSTGGYSNETGIEIGSASDKGRWIHVLYTQDGQTATLYLDGVKKGTQSTMPANSTNFGTDNVQYAWIGRAAFTSDSYLKQTLVSDIRLYDKILSADEITALAEMTDSLEEEYRYGTPGDFTALATAVAEAQAYVDANASSHTAAALAICQDEINRASNYVQEGRVNQSVINKELTALNDALTALKATAGFTFDVSGLTDSYDTERGFRHPGGFHTAADFERIRQQIADGNEKVVSAYNVLKNAEYSQSSCATWPVETIVRGGGVGENYINAARGATIAYQNGLRWQIDGSTAHAQHAVDVLMQWARTTTGIGGDSNYALAAGIYGYEFAQAAELVRDYEGWSAEDFATFKQWMINVWYPSCIGFLRGRNGTWENSSTWWQSPGHYWSNWGLCNALAVMSIGVLCDDVFIYNQGLSFFKYDMVGTFTDPRTETPIKNDGLTEFLGNLVVTTQESDLETGAYGKLGQMQESGRDIGHATMAAGLAVDIAQVGWNQGDDLFSYMDHRLAAGLEYVAAQTQSIENLPWTNYHYANSGYYYSDSRSWVQTGPALGEQIRPYWGTVIGHYEGVKGVKMPFSEWAYNEMGIDGGGTGSTSGGYDHMGYSVLTHTMNGLASADQVPTPLTPVMEYNGLTVEHNELGGLYHTYKTAPTTALAAGTVVTLKPQLPEDETDTGLWEWNTGETTKDITIVADRSGVWRATYTNANGVKSEQVFTIAVEGDCDVCEVQTYIIANGERVATDSVSVLYGSEVTLQMNGRTGWGYYEWENGSTASTLTLGYVTSSRDITGVFLSQGGRRQAVTFHIEVQAAEQNITVGTTTTVGSEAFVKEGSEVTLSLTLPENLEGDNVVWQDGSKGSSFTITEVNTSDQYTATLSLYGQTYTYVFNIYAKSSDAIVLAEGDYYVRHVDSNRFLTNNGEGAGSTPSFQEMVTTGDKAQIWHVVSTTAGRFGLMSTLDSLYLNTTGALRAVKLKVWALNGAIGINQVAWLVSKSSPVYVKTLSDGSIDWTSATELYGYPYEFIPADQITGITGVNTDSRTEQSGVMYDLSGRRVTDISRPGIYIVNGKKVFVR